MWELEVSPPDTLGRRRSAAWIGKCHKETRRRETTFPSGGVYFGRIYSSIKSTTLLTFRRCRSRRVLLYQGQSGADLACVSAHSIPEWRRLPMNESKSFRIFLRKAERIREGSLLYERAEIIVALGSCPPHNSYLESDSPRSTFTKNFCAKSRFLLLAVDSPLPSSRRDFATSNLWVRLRLVSPTLNSLRVPSILVVVESRRGRLLRRLAFSP